MDIKSVQLTDDEFNAFALAIKSRLTIIESKALAFSGETPATFKRCLENDWEWVALCSIARKFNLND